MRKLKDSGVEWIGEIPTDWSIGRIKYNFYLKGRIGWQGLKADEFVDNGPFLVTGTDFENGNVNWSKCYHISEERYMEAPEIHVENGDLLVTKDGTVGKVAYINNKPEKVSLNSHLLLIRPNSQLYYNKFLFWVIQSPIFDKYFSLSQNGTIMASLSQEKINNFSFPLPGMETQQCIADYLDRKCSQIDAIIARQQEVIEKLKAYKLSKINEIVVEVEGITAHLGYVANMKNGLNFNVVPDGKTLKFLGVGDFKDHYVLNSEEMFSDILVNDEITSEYMLQSGDIIFVRSNGSRELVGRAVMVENVTFPLSYSGFCIRFRNLRTDILNSKYLLYFFRSPYFRKQLEKYSQGSNITNINQVLLSQISIIIPPFKVQLEAIRKVEKLLAAIDKLITGKQEIVSALERYKKSLIYEVVTGKKEV